MQQQSTTRQALQQARLKFLAGDYATAKNKLEQLSKEQEDIAIQLNKLLIEFESGNQDNCEAVLSKLLTLLTQTNIELYKKHRPNEINFIPHEMLYYNIVAIAEYLGKHTVSELVSAEALSFYRSMQTNTSLMLIAQNLRRALSQNRFSTCLQLVREFQQVVDLNRNLTGQEEKFSLVINVMFVEVLLKLHMVDQSQALFMLKFDENDGNKFVTEDKLTRTRRKNKFVYKDFVNYLRAEIDFTSKNYEKSIHAMLGYLASESNKQKIFAENNIAINLCASGRASAGQKIFINNLQILHKVLSTNKKAGTELPELFQKTKENIVLSYLIARNSLDSQTHYIMQSDQKCYNQMKTTQQLYSFKQQYRRGQACLNLYHSSLEKSARRLPWDQIHDNYDNTYYLPNVPYYHFKGKNKNAHLSNRRPVYKRYVLNDWNDQPGQEQVDKDQNRRKFEKQANAMKLNEILGKAEESFRKSLLLLQKQESIRVKIEGPEADMTKPINEKLYHQYTKFKSSLLCLLAYTSLCLCKWTDVIKYAEQFTAKKCGQISPENNYSVLTYQIEAYCELNRLEDAYKCIHVLLGSGLLKNYTFDCRDGSNLGNCNMEFDQNQEMNLIFNMAVLHSRDNRIPETHQSIQNLFTKMNVLQSYPKAELPLSTLQLLIHYNLRIQNFSAALQLIKRHRILGASTLKPIFNITK